MKIAFDAEIQNPNSSFSLRSKWSLVRDDLSMLLNQIDYRGCRFEGFNRYSYEEPRLISFYITFLKSFEYSTNLLLKLREGGRMYKSLRHWFTILEAISLKNSSLFFLVCAKLDPKSFIYRFWASVDRGKTFHHPRYQNKQYNSCTMASLIIQI